MTNQQTISSSTNSSTHMAVPAMLPLPGAKSPETSQIQYADLCRKDPHTARSDGVVYRWAQDHWKALSDEDLKEDALNWLSNFDRARATAAMAESCVETAKLRIRKLPEKPKSPITLIPLHGRWLFVEPLGAITAIEPDSSAAVCHRIACDKAIPLGPYVPAPLPMKSMFAEFLASSLPNQDVQDFVQEYIGYTLTATSKFQVGTLWVGAGSNGKSLLLNVVRALHERSAAIRLDKLAGFDLHGLVGASLAFADETPKSKINQQALKSLISGGVVQVEPKYGRPFNYRSTAKFIICSNHLPAATDHSDGWWRRLHIVEWNQQIKGKQIVHDLDEKIIHHELDLVLNWALVGLQRLLRRGGFEVPQVMEAAKQEAMQTSNTVKSWSEDAGLAVSAMSGKMISKADLYERYRNHCVQQGLTIVGHAEFFKRLKAIFPQAREDRVVEPVNGVKQRVRRIGLAIGVFEENNSETHAQLNTTLKANGKTEDKPDRHADLNAMLMANIPTEDVDFDPFKNR